MSVLRSRLLLPGGFSACAVGTGGKDGLGGPERWVGGWVGGSKNSMRLRASKRDAKRSGAAGASASASASVAMAAAAGNDASSSSSSSSSLAAAGSPVRPVVVERVPPREDDVPRHVQRRRLGRLRQRPQPGARERRRLCGDGDCCRRRRRLTGGRHVVLQEIGGI